MELINVKIKHSFLTRFFNIIEIFEKINYIDIDYYEINEIKYKCTISLINLFKEYSNTNIDFTNNEKTEIANFINNQLLTYLLLIYNDVKINEMYNIKVFIKLLYNEFGDCFINDSGVLFKQKINNFFLNDIII